MLFDTFADTVWRPSCVKLRECTKVGYESALACHILPRWRGKDIVSFTIRPLELMSDKKDVLPKANAIMPTLARCTVMP